MAANKRRQDEKHLKILRELGSQPHNKQCFDCHQRGPTYVNMTVGSFVCTSCSGILRGLNPPHRVKSISMTSFTPEEIEFIKGKGNQYCRRVWLGTYDTRSVAEPESKDEQRIKDFMIQKYERKCWYVDPGTIIRSQSSQLPTATITPTSSLPEPKPLSSILGNQVKPLVLQSTQGISMNRPPASLPVGSQPARPSLDLLSELTADPFASTPTSATGQPASNANANFADFDSFNSSAPLPFKSCLLQNVSSSSMPSLFALGPPPPSPSRKPRCRHSSTQSLSSRSALTAGHCRAPVNRDVHEAWSSFETDSPPSCTTPLLLGFRANNNPNALPQETSVTKCPPQSQLNAVLDCPEATNSTEEQLDACVLPDFSFPGVSSPPSVGGTPMSTTSTGSQFGGFTATAGTPGVPVATPAGGSSTAPQQDKYAALADLDSLFNSSGSTTTTPAPPAEWEGGKTNSSPWSVNGASPGIVSGTPTSSVSATGFPTGSPNPFSSNSSQTWPSTQQPQQGSGFVTGNPFSPSFPSQTIIVSSNQYGQFGSATPISSPPGYVAYPTANGQVPQYAAVQNGNFTPSAGNVGWPVGSNGGGSSGGWVSFGTTQPPQTYSGAYQGSKINATGSHMGAWQPAVTGNPFAPGVTHVQPHGNSSNPFL